MSRTTPLVFVDIKKREDDELDRLKYEKIDLENRKKQNRDTLPADQAKRLVEIQEKLKRQANGTELVDPLFVAVRDGLKSFYIKVGNHRDGILPSQRDYNAEAVTLAKDAVEAVKKAAANRGDSTLKKGAETSTKALDDFAAELSETLPKNSKIQSLAETAKEAHANSLDTSKSEAAKAAAEALDKPTWALLPNEKALVAVFGFLEADGNTVPDDPRFSIAAAVDEYTRKYPSKVTKGQLTSNQALFDEVLDVLINDGDITLKYEFECDKIAAVFRSLRNDGVEKGDSLLPLRVRSALSKVAGATEGGPTSSSTISLPDIETIADSNIQKDNIKAMQVLYFAAMLDEMKFFQAMDSLLEQWQLGAVVITNGRANDKIGRYWRKAIENFSDRERLNFFSRGFGLAGGDPIAGPRTQALASGGAAGGSPNREFKSLWIRFLAAVSQVARQVQVDNILRANVPMGVSQEQVRQSGRDLAANLTLHGYGMAYFAAVELQKQINAIIDVLNDEDVRSAYGARDMFQVIEQIILLSTGEMVNSVQKRVSANAGAVIIAWLAEHARQLSNIGYGPLLDPQIIRNPPPRLPGVKVTDNPTDADLVNAVEQWLTVNGIQDEYIEQQAQAAEPPRTPSRPIQIPAIGRDLMESVGLPMTAAASHGNGNGYASNRRQ